MEIERLKGSEGIINGGNLHTVCDSFGLKGLLLSANAITAMACNGSTLIVTVVELPNQQS